MSKHFRFGWVLLLSSAFGVSVSNAQNAKAPPTLTELKGVTNLVYSPDGSYLFIDYRASASRPDRSKPALGIWDANTGKFRIGMQKAPDACDRISLSPDGKKAAAIAMGPRQLKIWDVATGKLTEEQKLPEWKGSIASAPFLKFSGDGKSLYSVWKGRLLEAKLGGTNRLVSADLKAVTLEEMAFEPAAKLYVAAHNIQGRPAAEFRTFDLDKDGQSSTIRLTNHVRAIALSQDGKTLAISYLRGSGKPRLELWDVPAFTRRTTFPIDERSGFQNYQTMIFSPGGKTIAGAPVFDAPNETVLDLLDLNGKIVHQITHKQFVRSLTFSPDSKTLAATLSSNSLLFVDVESGKAKQP